MQESFQTLVSSLWNDDAANTKLDQQNHEQQRECRTFINALCIEGDAEPSYKHAMDVNHPEHVEWTAAVQKELDTLQARNTWILVPEKNMMHRKKRPVRHRILLKKKMVKNGSLFNTKLVL